jgi:rfaE bifunctional protein nucleotidyltransferase chain/domain
MPVTVFTNGCFDLLHPGHVDLLQRARALGDRLIVGLNSDCSVSGLKGDHKPYVPQEDRRQLLLGLRAVDEVIIFDEPTPEALIRRIRPDVLVKGGDWTVDKIVGADFVQSYGGKVVSLELLAGYSSSQLAAEIARKVNRATCLTAS